MQWFGRFSFARIMGQHCVNAYTSATQSSTPRLLQPRERHFSWDGITLREYKKNSDKLVSLFCFLDIMARVVLVLRYNFFLLLFQSCSHTATVLKTTIIKRRYNIYIYIYI